MIKKNEIKLNTSNKRLFSDISTSHNLNLTNKNLLNQSNQSIYKTQSGLVEDENDGQNNNNVKKFARINSFNSFNRPIITNFNHFNQNKNVLFTDSGQSSSVLTKIVTSNQSPKKELPNNLITMVMQKNTQENQADNNGILRVGNNFAKRLQKIQSDRV